MVAVREWKRGIGPGGKFFRTVGDADADIVINYVRNHRFQQATLDGFPGTA